MKIAVIGGGVGGITASFLLQKEHEVTLFEKNNYVGGHTNTVVIEKGPDEGTPVDTGFIVLNNKNYPTFNLLLSELGVPIRDSNMSFSYYAETSGFQYSSNFPDGLFAQRRNLLRPSFWRMIIDILRFNQDSRRRLREGSLARISLGEYLKAGGYSKMFVEKYVTAMGAAIWSTPSKQMLDFPAQSFVQFFENHGLLTFKDRPQWKSVVGGSHTYVKTFLKTFRGTVEQSADVRGVRRTDDGVLVRTGKGDRNFDKVVIATHADEALKLLEDPTADEKRLLGPWRYSENRTVLHTDSSVMPPKRRAWASWNYVQESGSGDDQPVSVSYHMNRLQGLRTKREYFVTLNRARPIPQEHIIREILYTHPTYTFESFATQKELPKLNGPRHTYFCGSYFGYGFHEDAVKSGAAVAQQFGITW